WWCRVYPETIELEWRSGQEGVRASFYSDRLVEWSTQEYGDDGSLIRGHGTLTASDISSWAGGYNDDPQLRQACFERGVQNSLSRKLRRGTWMCEAKAALGEPTDTWTNLRTASWDLGFNAATIKVAFREGKACRLEISWQPEAKADVQTLSYGEPY